MHGDAYVSYWHCDSGSGHLLDNQIRVKKAMKKNNFFDFACIGHKASGRRFAACFWFFFVSLLDYPNLSYYLKLGFHLYIFLVERHCSLHIWFLEPLLGEYQ